MSNNSLIVREGNILGKYSYLALGEGPPLVVFRGLTPSNKPPQGLTRWAELRMLKPFASSFTVISLGRRVHLEPGITMSDLAADYAEAIQSEFAGGVNILGISTAGSIALQFAVDHPQLLRRLVIAGSAYKLGPTGKEVQRKYAELLQEKRYRAASSTIATIAAKSRFGSFLLAKLSWLAEPLGREDDYSDMIATLAAEDMFDIEQQLHQIKSPTLIIGGEHDLVYPAGFVRRTAELIPNSGLIIYDGRGHRDVFTDKHFVSDIKSFL